MTTLAQIQQIIQQDPEIQALLQQSRQSGASNMFTGGMKYWKQHALPIKRLLKEKYNIDLPQNVHISGQGRIEKDTGTPWLGMATSFAAPFIAGGLGSLFGNSATPASTAASTGINLGEAGTFVGPTLANGVTTGATGALAGLSRGLGRFGAVLPQLGSVFAGTTANRAAGREAEGKQIDQANQTQTRLFDILSRNALEQGRQGADLAAFQRDSPSVRYQQGIKGNLAANLQDFKWAPNLAGGRVQPFEFSGGLRPSAIGAGGRGIGEELAKVAAANLGKDTYALPTMPPAPALQGMPQSGVADTLLNTGGTALNFLNALSPLLRRNKPAQPAPRPWDAYEDWQ